MMIVDRVRSRSFVLSLWAMAGMALPAPTLAEEPGPGEGPNLGPRITQDMVAFELSLRRIRWEGRRIFSTPFNRFDGLGDGPIDPFDKISPGGRPTLQNNGLFLRINGLDTQSCLECHNVLSSAEIPATFAVGGSGGIGASAFPGVIDPDIDDSENNGFAAIQGRFINPPFNFGAGGVELVAREMTAELQGLKAAAQANPGSGIDLVTKGVSFGSIVFEGGEFDTSNVEGIDDDLVVRPFGRKGCCATIREFDVGALRFHHGIEPVEVAGLDEDPDGDGVANELSIGELSALHVFQAALERPRVRWSPHARRGQRLFREIRCAECHTPVMRSESRFLDLSFPEVPTDPSANVYLSIDLSRAPPNFERAGDGLLVKMFSDLKRHDLGPDLAESTGDALDAFFVTPRLWGVADTAPYLHDGRAVTLTDAILLHGGEGQLARELFESLFDSDKKALLAFLRALRTPSDPSRDLRRRAALRLRE